MQTRGVVNLFRWQRKVAIGASFRRIITPCDPDSFTSTKQMGIVRGTNSPTSLLSVISFQMLICFILFLISTQISRSPLSHWTIFYCWDLWICISCLVVGRNSKKAIDRLTERMAIRKDRQIRQFVVDGKPIWGKLWWSATGGKNIITIWSFYPPRHKLVVVVWNVGACGLGIMTE